jgi:hypothetical protein
MDVVLSLEATAAYRGQAPTSCEVDWIRTWQRPPGLVDEGPPRALELLGAVLAVAWLATCATCAIGRGVI